MSAAMQMQIKRDHLCLNNLEEAADVYRSNRGKQIKWHIETHISQETNKFFDFTLWFLARIKTRTKHEHLFSTPSIQHTISHIAPKIIFKDLFHMMLLLVVRSWIVTPIFIHFTEG